MSVEASKEFASYVTRHTSLARNDLVPLLKADVSAIGRLSLLNPSALHDTFVAAALFSCGPIRKQLSFPTFAYRRSTTLGAAFFSAAATVRLSI